MFINVIQADYKIKPTAGHVDIETDFEGKILKIKLIDQNSRLLIHLTPNVIEKIIRGLY